MTLTKPGSKSLQRASRDERHPPHLIREMRLFSVLDDDMRDAAVALRLLPENGTILPVSGI
ncbi:hypothetical protein GS910_26000 [Paraburkholderia sp. RL16-012-BIC-B]|nr:hypothetical protein [Paraburkholderia madseniana]